MMAVVRPSAVFTSASEIPSASCAASGAGDMARNARIIPTVVPSRPSSVAIDASVGERDQVALGMRR